MIQDSTYNHQLFFFVFVEEVPSNRGEGSRRKTTTTRNGSTRGRGSKTRTDGHGETGRTQNITSNQNLTHNQKTTKKKERNVLKCCPKRTRARLSRPYAPTVPTQLSGQAPALSLDSGRAPEREVSAAAPTQV